MTQYLIRDKYCVPRISIDGVAFKTNAFLNRERAKSCSAAELRVTTYSNVSQRVAYLVAAPTEVAMRLLLSAPIQRFVHIRRGRDAHQTLTVGVVITSRLIDAPTPAA